MPPRIDTPVPLQPSTMVIDLKKEESSSSNDSNVDVNDNIANTSSSNDVQKLHSLQQKRFKEIEEQVSKDVKWFKVCYHNDARYLYVNSHWFGIVWKNAAMFFTLHILFFYALYIIFSNEVKPYKTWIFAYLYGHAAGIGITAGAHRLWSHKAYKASVPLRIMLIIFHTMAGQNDMYTWCRDHRLHHKFSETDADPHNSNRGMFFAHVGWLLTKKHPDVMIKGRTIDMSDIENDPVVMVQRKFYFPIYILLRFLLPMYVPIYFWQENMESAIIGVFAQYICSLHCTWFVNSAAHMFGDRPYDSTIQPRNNMMVNYAAMGEGFHNYHHTFPWDYTIDEHGWRFNLGMKFIELMNRLGLAYDLKRASRELIAKRKARAIRDEELRRKRLAGELEMNTFHVFDQNHPYIQPHET